MTRPFILALACASFCANVFFTPRELLEIKSLPNPSSETVLLVKPGAALSVISTVLDSAGREWYMVRAGEGGAEGFVLSSALEVAGTEKEEEIYLDRAASENEDKKRRLNEVKQHGEWPVRIKKAVRNGAICLKMTEEQLLASWREPYQKTKGFVLGLGEVRIFFYREKNPIAVVMKNDEVAGWSEKE